MSTVEFGPVGPPANPEEQTFCHASAVVIGEAGLLIFGPSGAGKSQLALALIAAAETAGLFARLIGDDRVSLKAIAGRVIVRGHPLILGKVERRGTGILELPFLSATVVRLAVRLVEPNEGPSARFPNEPQYLQIEGVRLPSIELRQDAAPNHLAALVLSDPRLRRLLKAI